MSASGTDKERNEKAAKFWKKETGPLPGSAKPLCAEEACGREQGLPVRHALSMPATPKKQGKTHDAFLEFERNTQDAWDAGEDGASMGSSGSSSLLHAAHGFGTATGVRVDPAVVRTTAEQVLQNHTRQQRQASAVPSNAGSNQNGGAPARRELAEPRGGVAGGAAPLPGNKTIPLAGTGPSGLAGRAASQKAVSGNVTGTLPLIRGSSSSSISAQPTGAPGTGSQTFGNSPSRNANASQSKLAEQDQRDQGRILRFEQVVYGSGTDIGELRQLSWSGIPKKLRPIVWKILSGYLPAVSDRRQPTLERKRAEYFGFIDQYFNTKYRDQHQETFRQIQIDVPRMNPLIALFQNRTVQEMFERILFIWAIRRPASGYVQGINDLVTPFFVVFLSEYTDTNVESPDADVSSLTVGQLGMIEADSFWCLSKLLDSIQDNYTFAQLGIQKKINQLKDLVYRIDYSLYRHLEANGIEFLQFSFRWMNNLLMRELPLRCAVRLWDTYQSEADGFASFHLYVCAAFLTTFSAQLLRGADFQNVMTMLQNLPTTKWGDGEVCELLAKAYQLKCMFADAPQHLKQHMPASGSAAGSGT